MLDKVRTLTKDQIFEIRKRIKPLKAVEGGLKWFNTKKCDPVERSYTWDCKTSWFKARGFVQVHKEYMNFPVTGYYGFFKPSEEEVLNCIPEELWSKVCGYSIDGDSSELARGGDSQIAEVTFYEKSSN